MVNGVKWELYNVTKDWTQADDVAAANPTKLKELQDLFWVEAQKYQVLPLDASSFTRVIAQRPSITAGRAEFTYAKPLTGILPGNEPNILNKSYVITADVTVPAGGGDGMLVTDGGRFGGYGLYLLKGKPVLSVQSGDCDAFPLGRRECAHAWQAQHRIQFQIRRAGIWKGRHWCAVR